MKNKTITLQQKLTLSQKPVIFFREGNFLRVYNHSFYIVTALFQFQLKPIVKRINKVDKIIIYSGFPIDSIYKRCPKAKPCVWGYEIKGNFNLIGYQRWFDYHCQQLNDYGDVAKLCCARSNKLINNTELKN